MSFVIILLVLGALNAYFAKRRGRDPIAWFFIGMLFGVLGILTIFILPPLKQAEETETKSVITVSSPQARSNISKDWFYLDATENQQGPYSWDVFQKSWNEGKFSANSYVWSEGMPEWKKVDEIDGLENDLVKQ